MTWIGNNLLEASCLLLQSGFKSKAGVWGRYFCQLEEAEIMWVDLVQYASILHTCYNKLHKFLPSTHRKETPKSW